MDADDVSYETFRGCLQDLARVNVLSLGYRPTLGFLESLRREGRLLKSGNARLRTVLIEAAWRWVAGDEAAKARYRRPVASTGNGKKAIVGMARRLAILLWRMSLSGEPYRAAA